MGILKEITKLIEKGHTEAAIKKLLNFLEKQEQSEDIKHWSKVIIMCSGQLKEARMEHLSTLISLDERNRQVAKTKKALLDIVDELKNIMEEGAGTERLLPANGKPRSQSPTQHAYKNCLRPVFTKRIYETLVLQYRSINVIGGKETGRSRLLKDLNKLLKQEGKAFIYIDFTRNLSYQGFIQQISEKLALLNPEKETNHPIPTIEGSRSPAIYMGQSLSSFLAKSNQKHLILLFDNFDRILENPDQRFPKSFFDDLNSLKNREDITLCCVSGKSVANYTIYYIDDEDGAKLKDRLSWLDLPLKELPKLEKVEIRQELVRVMLINEWSKEQDKEVYVNAILRHPQQLGFLNYVKENFHLEKGKNADEHVKRLEEKYQDHMDSSTEK